MKSKIYSFLTLVALVVAVSSCKNAPKNQVKSADAATAAAQGPQLLTVDLSKSTISWKGFKPGGEHFGKLGIKSGELSVEGNMIKSGSFVLDMNNIVCEDLRDETTNAKLVGHLKSADFFDTEKFPEGKFTITKVKEVTGDPAHNYVINGNLELKGITKNIAIPAKISNDGMTYKAVVAPFAINRTEWGVNYGSKNIFKNLKDSFINDDIEVSLEIETIAAPKGM